tara:strand:- start:3809 stop:4843 length:1035 start_codon:yes stop_codon:yes gene_type:complete
MTKERSKKSILIYTLLIPIFMVTTSVIAILYWPQNNMIKSTKITINNGESLSMISNKLMKSGVITNKKFFGLATKIMGLEKSIPVGSYQFDNIFINKNIIKRLVYGSPEIKRITLLEGWNIKQVCSHLSKEMGFDYNNLLEIINDKNFIQNLNLKSDNLEGYLYPETYYFFDGENEYSVIKRLVKEHKKFWSNRNKTKADSMNLTQHQIVTLASIIEGEAIYDSERSIISAVYHNRLKKAMKLQADPTVQYIIKDGPRRLLNKDLKIKSPYNTYLHKGLPPGPINSPGHESLKAALYPEENDYLYFVAKGDGYHTFSKNEKDHERAKRAFQRVRRKVKRERNGL